MSLFKSVTGIAKSALGQVDQWRKVVELNPSTLPFVMPPQVQMGLTVATKVATAVNAIAGTSIKVPTSDDLIKLATGQLDLIMKGARRPILDKVQKAQKDALDAVGKAEDILQSIDWLL